MVEAGEYWGVALPSKKMYNKSMLLANFKNIKNKI